MAQNRKKFIQQAGAGILFAGLPRSMRAADPWNQSPDPADFEGEGLADDEKFWKRIARKYYDIPGGYTNLENGYYGMQPKPVLEAYQKNIVIANQQGARFARKDFPALAISVKKDLAEFLSVTPEEIIITRNATEALNIAIQGYPFQPGDEVLLNQLDYFSMIETFRMLETRGQLKVKAFDMPLLPASDDEIVSIYEQQITERTKLILLTHVSNINGLIVPVAKIAAMANQKGIAIISDSAHALGQVPFSLPALGADFVGLNLHKWIGNPVGAGVLYIRKERIRTMKPLFGDVASAENDIRKLSHFGTTPFAVTMTIPESLSFHRMLGIEKINKRLHYLKSSWVNACKDIPDIEIVTPADPSLSCAIASFRIKNKTGNEVAERLYKDYGILTVGRVLGQQGCVRVTPSVFNSIGDIQKLVAAVQQIAKE